MFSSAHATKLLRASTTGGTAEGAPELVAVVYDQLRALARRHLDRERPNHTLQPTALAHEAYVRLIDNDSVDWQSKTHFFAVAATTLRRVLVDHARARGRQRRGGDRNQVTLESAGPLSTTETATIDVLALHDALEQLATLSPRQARVVDLRFFGGLSVSDTARSLDVSERTVKSDWAMACAWLRRALAGGEAN